MNYNYKFFDTMNIIDSLARQKRYKNGLDFAISEHKRGYVYNGEFNKYKNLWRLRTCFKNGNACDINISYETYMFLKDFERKVSFCTPRSKYAQKR